MVDLKNLTCTISYVNWAVALIENSIRICMAESLCCSPETITTLVVNQLYPSTKFKKKLKKDLAAVYVSVLPVFL